MMDILSSHNCTLNLGLTNVVDDNVFFVSWKLFNSDYSDNAVSIRQSYVRAQNLRQGIVMKTSFETGISQMGL